MTRPPQRASRPACSVAVGLRGDCKGVGSGVFELRIDQGPGYRVYCARHGNPWIVLLCGGRARKQKTSREHMTTGKTTKNAPASATFHAAGFLRSERDIAAYLETMLADGDARAIPLALRTVADAVGMTTLAERTGLSREALYRTLSEKGNPRLNTLAAVLDCFGLRLAVAPVGGKAGRKPHRRAA